MVSNRRYFRLGGKVINSITIEKWFLFHLSDNFIIVPSSFIKWIIQFPFCYCDETFWPKLLRWGKVYLAHTCRAPSVIEEVRMGTWWPACLLECHAALLLIRKLNAQPKKSSRNVEECCCDSLADPHLTSFLTQPSPPAQGILPPMVAWALLKLLAIRKVDRHAHRPVSPTWLFSWDSLLGWL